MFLGGDFICTAELTRMAALALYILFLIKFFAIHQNMGPAHGGNTCWHKLTSQSYSHPKVTHIPKLSELTEGEVTELASSTVDEAAAVILKRPGSRGISKVRSQRKFISYIQIWSIINKSSDKPLQIGSEELWNFSISPRNMESLPHIRIDFGSYSMER